MRPQRPLEYKITDNGCWEVTSHYRGNGYVNIKINNQTIGAHRLAWIKSHGPIPDKLLICHHCDNPSCINPDHLFMGSHFDNCADMIKKGRHPRLYKSHRTLEEKRMAKLEWRKGWRKRHPDVTRKGRREWRKRHPEGHMPSERKKKWDEIKYHPNAVSYENGIGYIRKSTWIDKCGFTLQQIGDYLGVSRQRILQISKSNPYRLEKAVKEMTKNMLDRKLKIG